MPTGRRFEPDISRLDVAMNQPAVVGRGQPQCSLAADPQHFLQRQFAFVANARSSSVSPSNNSIAWNGTPPSSAT